MNSIWHFWVFSSNSFLKPNKTYCRCGISSTGSCKSWESAGSNADLCCSNSVLSDSGVCTMFVSEMWRELLMPGAGSLLKWSPFYKLMVPDACLWFHPFHICSHLLENHLLFSQSTRQLLILKIN